MAWMTSPTAEPDIRLSSINSYTPFTSGDAPPWTDVGDKLQTRGHASPIPRISGPWTLDLGLWTLKSGPWTMDHGPWTLELGAWSLDPGAWSLELGPWTLDPGPWTLDPELPGWHAPASQTWDSCMRRVRRRPTPRTAPSATCHRRASRAACRPRPPPGDASRWSWRSQTRRPRQASHTSPPARTFAPAF